MTRSLKDWVGERNDEPVLARRRRSKARSGRTDHDIVVIGCSAGGVETLSLLFQQLPADLPAAFFVVMHVPDDADSMLPKLLNRVSQLPAQHAVSGAKLEHGCVYVAPPRFHLQLEPGRMVLNRGPRENRHRPAIDPLFRTAALHYGSRVIGIILSGALDDGTMWVKEIKGQGGLVIVQDPAEAIFPDMPRSALGAVKPDFCLTIPEIGAALPSLIQKPASEEVMKRRSKDRGMKPENKRVKTAKEITQKMGSPSVFVCPDCNGPLWEVREGKALLYRCMVGHAFGPENLFAAQTEEVERALWVALRSLEERIELYRQMAERSKSINQSLSARQFTSKSQENARHAKLIRQMLEKL